MIQVELKGDYFSVQSECPVTYIAPVNPRCSVGIVISIPEAAAKQSFTVTDLLDSSVVADEYLNFDCDHAVLTRKIVDGKYQYAGVLMGLTNQPGERFVIKKSLSHADCVALQTSKNGVAVANWNYAGMCNDSKTEERRHALQVYTQENTVWVK